MKQPFLCVTLLLVAAMLCIATSIPAFFHGPTHHDIVHYHAARGVSKAMTTVGGWPALATPCVGVNCVDAPSVSPNLSCGQANGTTIVAGLENRNWTLLCDMDFYAQDLYPFVLTKSFDACLQHCEAYNKAYQGGCAGFVFAPDRTNTDNDCYLKSSVNDVISPSTIRLVGATLLPSTPNQPAPVAPSSVVGADQPSGPDKGGLGSTLATPAIGEVMYLGTSSHRPGKQYVSHAPALPVKLSKKQLQPGIDLGLINNYPLAKDTGSWSQHNLPVTANLSELSVVPRLARDGGKGGIINGTYVFTFCDTSTYDDTGMNGLVSSSAATEASRGALEDKSLEMDDPLGQFQDDVGRLRGWIQMTAGEEAFNIAVAGDGFRYAVWPQSMFIRLNTTHSLIYASLVYLQVNMTTQSSNFTALGNSLVTVTVDPQFGPVANRVVNQLFGPDSVEWGSLGGYRAWGPMGEGAMDGMIYLFGQVDTGISIAKVAPTDITDLTKYSYWTGDTWSTTAPGNTSAPSLIQQEVMDFDLFYSPFHQSYFMVYLTPFADNTFWYRFLETAGAPIVPSYEVGGDPDYAERILHGEWSEPRVLWKVDPPTFGYIYAGGAHMGYFGSEDIINGGNWLLITWTEHTAVDPNDPSSGYAHKAAKLRIGWDSDTHAVAAA